MVAGLPRIRYVFWGGKRVIEMISSSREVVDAEWIQLIMEAKNMGLDQSEIRAFLQCHLEKEVEKV